MAFLIGTSVAATLFVFQNLETWDLNDAIENSSNGKVKLEYFYSTNIVFPYYQEYQNFEPWDNNKVEILLTTIMIGNPASTIANTSPSNPTPKTTAVFFH